MLRRLPFLAVLSLLTGAFAMLPVYADTPRIIIPINPAPTITAPANNARVSSPLTVKGKAGKNRQVKVHVVATYTDGEQDLGTFTTTANNAGEWQTTPINLWLPEGAKNARYKVSAVQMSNDHASIAKTITVLPPLNIIYRPIGNLGNILLALAPAVTSPANNARVQSPLTIRGTASKNKKVEINVTAHFTTKEGDYTVARQQDLGTFAATANNEGKWNTAPVNLWLPEGAGNAHFEIIASQKVSDTVYKSQMVKVLPPLNIRLVPMGPILLNLAPKITSPSANARVNSPLTIEGTASKNNSVQVNVKAIFDGGEQDLGTFTTTADADGKWRTTPIALWLPENAHNAKYDITASQKVGSHTYPSKITVLPPLHVIIHPIPVPLPLILSPTITKPTEDQEVSSPLVIRGKGVKGNTIKVHVSAEWVKRVLILKFDRDKDFGTFTTTVQPNGTWQTSPIDIDLGDDAEDIEYTITAVQIYPGDKESDKVTLKVEGEE